MVPDSSIWDVLRPVDSRVEMTAYVQDGFAASDDYAHVSHIASSLLGELNSPGSRSLRAVANTPDQAGAGEPEHALGLVLVEFTRYGMEGSPSLARSQLVLSPVIHIRRPGALHLHALTGIT